MSDPLRDAFRAVAEPGVGDAYGRFVLRRRRARGLRLLSGVVIGAVATLGFVRVYPGVTGAVPDQGPISGPAVQPGIGVVREYASEPLGITLRYPASWSVIEDDGGTAVRFISGLEGSVATPKSFEIRIGPSCAQRECFWPDALAEPRIVDRQGGVTVEATTLPFGAVRTEAVLMRYPSGLSKVDALRSPWCDGCVLVRYDTPAGRALPVIFAAPDVTTLRRAEREIAFVLSTLEFSR